MFRRVPVLTISLLVWLTLCFLFQWSIKAFDYPNRIWAFLGVSRPLIGSGHFLRLLTASFFHVNPGHFISNAAGLIFCVAILEYTAGPWRALLVVSLAMIAGHNLFDRLVPEQFGSFGWLWTVLHVGPRPLPISEHHTIFVVYPLIPWIGVMAAGYCLGRVFDLPEARRRHILWQLGVGLTGAFIVIRAINLYGDLKDRPCKIEPPSPLRIKAKLPGRFWKSRESDVLFEEVLKVAH
jgi:hypothetical protein